MANDLNHRVLEMQRDLYRFILAGAESGKEGLEDFLHGFLRRTLELTGTRLGRIEVRDVRSGSEWSTQVAHGDDQEQIRKVVSSTIVKGALEKGRIVFTRSALLDPKWSDSNSVRTGRIETVLCAPFEAEDCRGVLYLQGGFDEALPGPLQDHLEYPSLFKKHILPLLMRLLPSSAPAGSLTELREMHGLNRFVGESEAIQHLLRDAVQVAPFPLPILITGETGTGKSLLADAIHRISGRKGRLVHLNCAGIPRDLFESELFGHVKGAFTGAVDSRQGFVEVADKGTLFLDEIGELPFEHQKKLLMLLEEGEYFPVGAREPKKADVRIISATHVDLSHAVAAGAFRKDLFYRISVYPIHAPPLRERKEDVPLLAKEFLKRAFPAGAFKPPELAAEAARKLMDHSWPGNLRELDNLAKVLGVKCLSAGKSVIEADSIHFPGHPGAARPAATVVDGASRKEDLRADRETWERLRLEEALRKAKWNVALASRDLDISRSQLYNLLNKHGLTRGGRSWNGDAR